MLVYKLCVFCGARGACLKLALSFPCAVEPGPCAQRGVFVFEVCETVVCTPMRMFSCTFHLHRGAVLALIRWTLFSCMLLCVLLTLTRVDCEFCFLFDLRFDYFEPSLRRCLRIDLACFLMFYPPLVCGCVPFHVRFDPLRRCLRIIFACFFGLIRFLAVRGGFVALFWFRISFHVHFRNV